MLLYRDNFNLGTYDYENMPYADVLFLFLILTFFMQNVLLVVYDASSGMCQLFVLLLYNAGMLCFHHLTSEPSYI